MEAVFLKLLNMSIAAGWLVLAVIALRVILKKAPKTFRCFLWALVGIRLICPVSFESVFSLIPSAETVPEDILYAKEPTIHTGVSAINHVVNPILAESMSPTVGDSVNPMQVLTFIATVLWIVGVVGMALYALISYMRIHKIVAASLNIEENLYVCDDIDNPFILGIFRPRIYIPSTLEKDQIPYVIAHEMAHLKRHDHWWKPFGFMLLTVYWFNPIIWAAYVLLCRDIELACDEKVIKELGEGDKKAYSNTLLACSVSRKTIVACPLAFGEVGVKERVKTVLNYKKPAFWVVLIAVVVCILVVVCFLTNPKEERNSPLGLNYHVEECVYSTPRLLISSQAYILDCESIYHFAKEYIMSKKEYNYWNNKWEEWEHLGTMEPIELTEENFDALFRDWQGLSGLYDDFSPSEFRQQNEAAWQLIIKEANEYSYYLLQQRNGDIYLACWYYDEDRDTGKYPDNSEIWFLYKMVRADNVTGTVEVTAESTFEEIEWAEKMTEQTDGTVEEMDTSKEKNTEKVGESVMETPATAEEETIDSLEAAIHQVLMGSDKDKMIENVLFPCESHVILGTEYLCGYPLADGTGGEQLVTVYLLVLRQSYTFQAENGAIIDDGGSHTAEAITFRIEGDGIYTLVEYWIPMDDGYYYVEAVREKFPDNIEEEAFNTQKYILAQMQNCYEQAVQFANVDTDSVIEELFEKIVEKASHDSNPQTYIENHTLEYREFTYYGKYTLQYCFKEFLKGGQTDLRGHIMKSVCKEISKGYGEELVVLGDDELKNGQEWFDALCETAEDLEEQYGSEALADKNSVLRMLIGMLEEQ